MSFKSYHAFSKIGIFGQISREVKTISGTTLNFAENTYGFTASKYYTVFFQQQSKQEIEKRVVGFGGQQERNKKGISPHTLSERN